MGVASLIRSPPEISGVTSHWRYHLQSEVSPLISLPIGGITWLLTTGVAGTHVGPNRNTHLHATMQRGGTDVGVRWTCRHIWVHVHILTKVWDQRMGDWNMQAGQQRGTFLHKYAKWVGQMCGDRWTCIQVLMHDQCNDTHTEG